MSRSGGAQYLINILYLHVFKREYKVRNARRIVQTFSILSRCCDLRSSSLQHAQLNYKIVIKENSHVLIMLMVFCWGIHSYPGAHETCGLQINMPSWEYYHLLFCGQLCRPCSKHLWVISKVHKN